MLHPMRRVPEMTTLSAPLPRTWRRPMATVGIAALSAAFFAVVSNEALIDSWLVRTFGTTPDPVFPTPLIYLTMQHLAVVAISSALTVAIGVPLGAWVTRTGGADFRDIVSAGVDFGQSFPPIAVLALMFPIFGLSPASAILALFLYGLLPVVSNTVAGLDAVPPAVTDAARGMGLGRWRVLVTIELPLAIEVILAGVRTSVIVNVGTATVAAAIGAGGLGLPIFTGISTSNTGYVIEGALAVSALALILDGSLAVLSRWIAPRGVGATAD